VKISFIGAGKMAEALMARLPASENVIITDVNKARLNLLKRKYRVELAKDNFEAYCQGEIVILAVKPQNMSAVLANLAPQLKSGASALSSRIKLIVSIAAGVPLAFLQKGLPGVLLVRAMPNNPALVGKGITALAHGPRVTPKMLTKVRKLFDQVGETVIVPERLLDAVTGLSGSGPAFVYLAIEGLALGGVVAGLPKKLAFQLAVATALGAAETLKVTQQAPEELINLVASPGGTTIEGLKVLKRTRLSRNLLEAVVAAAKKSKIMSKRWAKE